MNKRSLLAIGLSVILFSATSVQAENITQFIIEKRINFDRKSGYILASDLEPLKHLKERRTTVYASDILNATKHIVNYNTRTYQISSNPDSFKSLIEVKAPDGTLLKKISVGRQALKLVASQKSGSIFVLCGGYFGSVWQIDPETNQVIKKFSTSWNPTDISLDPDEKYLYVSSGKLQKFSIDSDIVLDIALPDNVRYLDSINYINNSAMIFGAVNTDGTHSNLKMMNNSNKLMPGEIDASYKESESVSISKMAKSSRNIDDLAIVYSKSNDFLYLFSLMEGDISGLIPLDARADEVLLAPKLKKAYVLHRTIGQISLIDLSPDSLTKYSVFARIMDSRLKDSTNTMVLEGNKVFIKSDAAQEGYIDTDNILRFTSPVVEIPFNKQKEVFEVSSLANKRYYLRNNQIYLEELNDSSVNYSHKSRLIKFGNNIGGIEMSPDGKLLFVSDYSQNLVYLVDPFTAKIKRQFLVGSEPTEIVLHDNFLYILNRGDHTISKLDTGSGEIVKVNRLKVENNNLNVIKLYDKKFDQIIKVSLANEVNKELTMIKALEQN